MVYHNDILVLTEGELREFIEQYDLIPYEKVPLAWHNDEEIVVAYPHEKKYIVRYYKKSLLVTCRF